MDIKVEDKGDIRTVTVSLPDYRNPRDRVSYSRNELDKKLREAVDLENYLLIPDASSGTICNYQINNTGTYVFTKSKTTTVQETVVEKVVDNSVVQTTEAQATKTATPKKRKKYTSRK